MVADADHEVIDSAEALFRHLYEEHGVEEARDLDPETAPVQFWVRRHAELEREQRATRHRAEPRPEPEPRPQPEVRQPQPRPQPEARQRPEPRPHVEERPQPPAGRRPAGFGDPLVEAVARALAGRGYDQAAVRAAIRGFAGAGGGLTGEAAVRASFIEPMLASAAQHLLGAGGSRRPAGGPPPAAPAPASTSARPAAPPPAPDRDPRPARDEPARPEAAWAVLWADLADTGRRKEPSEPGTAAGDGDDLMAVANAVQQRRRVRRLRR
jgi:hypothetical protein